MAKGKKIFLIILSVIILALCIPAGIQIYYYNNPQTDLHISIIGKDNARCPMILLGYNARSIFGYNPKVIKKINAAGDEIRLFTEELRFNYTEYDVDAEYSSKTKPQTIHLTGYKIDSYGNRVEIDEIIELDFRINEYVYKDQYER